MEIIIIIYYYHRHFIGSASCFFVFEKQLKIWLCKKQHGVINSNVKKHLQIT